MKSQHHILKREQELNADFETASNGRQMTHESSPDIRSDRGDYINQNTRSDYDHNKDLDSSLMSNISKSDDVIIIKNDTPTKKQNVKQGFLFAIIFSVSQGVVFTTTKVALQKYDLKISQMLVPQSLMLMLCAFIFGSMNGVSFQDSNDRRRIYSFYSYSWPGTPYIH